MYLTRALSERHLLLAAKNKTNVLIHTAQVQDGQSKVKGSVELMGIVFAVIALCKVVMIVRADSTHICKEAS